MMLIDSHCHLDAAEFNGQQAQLIQDAVQQNVQLMVIPAVDKASFQRVKQLSENPHCVYALGIHPMYVMQAQASDLDDLQQALEQSPERLVAIGEIGLDYFVEGLDRSIQQQFFVAQLKLAQRYQLPVILHVRHAIDDVLKYLRRHHVVGGIAHAFNGSPQQAEQFIQMGFKLGFGGACTYTRANKIRQLAKDLPEHSLVLETDAPDIPPAWLKKGEFNQPKQLTKIAHEIASLRGIAMSQVADTTTKNVLSVLPKIAKLYTPPKVLL
jgi:TatD DNase family protein